MILIAALWPHTHTMVSRPLVPADGRAPTTTKDLESGSASCSEISSGSEYNWASCLEVV